MSLKKRLLQLTIISLSLVLASCNNKKTPSESSESSHEDTGSTETFNPEDYDPLDPIDVDPFDRTYTKIASDSLYVNKVENLTDQNYIIGMDASSVISLEESGVKFYDFEGNESDVFKVLSDNGINYIRVRVWNDPFDSEGHGYGGGNNDINRAVEIGKRATQYNMSLLVDFHYSDFWADPAKQMAPKAWEDMFADEKADALYEYTKTSLQKLLDNNIKVGMVQIGNEINGFKMAGEVGINSTIKLLKKGSQAVREIYPNALVAVHFANPEKSNNYLDWAKLLDNNKLDYDVFGSSYYPYWHGTLENLSTVLSKIAALYNKRVMVMETSYAYTTEDSDFFGNTISTSGYDVKTYPFSIHGQVNLVREVLDTIVNHTLNGLGICYWEGTWISVGTKSYEENFAKWEQYGSGWASSYASDYDPNDAGKFYGGTAVDNQAFFDSTGHPIESLKVFNLMRFGNTIENRVDGVEDVEVIHYDNETFTLPETVNAIYINNERKPIPVTWDAFDIEAAKAKGNAKYSIHGVADGYDVVCRLTIMEFNYLKNYSFETGDYTDWKMSTEDTLSATHIIKVTNENPQTGKYAAHFWTNEDGGVKFELTQEVALDAGTYKLQASFLGGGNGSDAIASRAQTVYIYAKDASGNIIAQEDHTITKWADGYKDCLLKGISHKGGKITIGIHVEIITKDCWGDIDDVMLNKA